MPESLYKELCLVLGGGRDGQEVQSCRLLDADMILGLGLLLWE